MQMENVKFLWFEYRRHKTHFYMRIEALEQPKKNHAKS